MSTEEKYEALRAAVRATDEILEGTAAGLRQLEDKGITGEDAVLATLVVLEQQRGVTRHNLGLSMIAAVAKLRAAGVMK
jgi:hypothetical protein